ncbi:MAG TPA: protease HtpX [bacterium]|jgi:heat shock protein HtpX|nr:protease HtpX [bacterium]
MSVMKRIFLVVFTNILIMLALGVIWTVLVAVFPSLGGMDNVSLAVLSLLWGFGGAIISLLLSKTLAKRMQGVQVIDIDRAGPEERWLVSTVHSLAREVGITGMPEVGIWDSPEVNAFCTGPSKNSSLVAVSTGILRRMNHDELEGVLAHELSHAANGDMVTMTLVQGVVNSFVIFASFILSRLLAGGNNRNRGGGFMEVMVRMVLQVALSTLAAVLIIYPFSRWREFRADAGGARLAGKNKMIGALQALQDSFRLPQGGPVAAPALATMKISSDKRANLFSTHPSLEERIEALNKL